MKQQVLVNNIFCKIQRIKHKDRRFMRLSLEFVDAEDMEALEAIDKELTKIIDEISEREKKEFGV